MATNNLDTQPTSSVRVTVVGGIRIVVLATDDGMYAFEHPSFGLAIAERAIHGNSTTWDTTTAESTDGRQLHRLPTRRLYAFAWRDDHGEGAFYGYCSKYTKLQMFNVQGDNRYREGIDLGPPK
ncbi:hypothetical protein [Halalkalirubrum salinum]|uniref:hypothetical protein n=1 Tax=Halalkalirubrum salinum TaxID=2563889 RepID=UPI0010FADD7A|nr:hypothetical protein [Halalkalirubrum salinum]